jgi:hypothetical protein
LSFSFLIFLLSLLSSVIFIIVIHFNHNQNQSSTQILSSYISQHMISLQESKSKNHQTHSEITRFTSNNKEITKKSQDPCWRPPSCAAPCQRPESGQPPPPHLRQRLCLGQRGSHGRARPSLQDGASGARGRSVHPHLRHSQCGEPPPVPSRASRLGPPLATRAFAWDWG